MERPIIREATSEDCEHLMTLIKDSAVYHHVPNAAKVTPQILKADGFGEQPFYKCILAEMPADESGGQKARVVGHAMYFFGYSVMRGRMVYLENLHVMPEFRGVKAHVLPLCVIASKTIELNKFAFVSGKGIGRRLMCKVAEIGLDSGCIELRFLTMEWNSQGREFYTRLGAQDTTETKKFRSMEIGKEDLQKMVQSGKDL